MILDTFTFMNGKFTDYPLRRFYTHNNPFKILEKK